MINNINPSYQKRISYTNEMKEKTIQSFERHITAFLKIVRGLLKAYDKILRIFLTDFIFIF